MGLSRNQAKGRFRRLSNIGFYLIRKLFSSKVCPNIGEIHYTDNTPVISYSTDAFKYRSKSFERDDGVVGIVNPKISSGDAISDGETALSINVEPNKDGCAKNVDELSVESEEWCNFEVLIPDNFCEASLAESTGNKLGKNKNLNEPSVNQLANIEEENSKNVDDKAVQTHDVIKDDVSKCDCTVLVRSDEGELSFSNAGFINFSGPIAFSGTISLRYFAFPELQSDWDLSPIRSPKPFRGRFQRCWDECAENADEQPVESKDTFNLEVLRSDKLETNEDENVNEQSFDQLTNIKENNSNNVDGQAVESRDFIKDDVEKCDRCIPVQSDRGELSFSSFVTSSEPIAFSGSHSLQSDASRDSAQSFSYPILQSEWNSSPLRMPEPSSPVRIPEPDRLQSEWNSSRVRMAKADKRHFPRRWNCRLGLLCCRF